LGPVPQTLWLLQCGTQTPESRRKTLWSKMTSPKVWGPNKSPTGAVTAVSSPPTTRKRAIADHIDRNVFTFHAGPTQPGARSCAACSSSGVGSGFPVSAIMSHKICVFAVTTSSSACFRSGKHVRRSVTIEFACENPRSTGQDVAGTANASFCSSNRTGDSARRRVHQRSRSSRCAALPHNHRALARHRDRGKCPVHLAAGQHVESTDRAESCPQIAHLVRLPFARAGGCRSRAPMILAPPPSVLTPELALRPPRQLAS
jgi:hypothetical protein